MGLRDDFAGPNWDELGKLAPIRDEMETNVLKTPRDGSDGTTLSFAFLMKLL